MVTAGEQQQEIAFFDVETTVPTRSGQGFALLEFGAILVCPRKLVELESYSTLVRPSDLSLISSLSVRCNGITKDDVVSAPTFSEVADKVYDLLNGRIWAGHNILRFDCRRIKEAFAIINQPPPEPKGIIDSLALLTQRFGRRAGDMKMTTLATYFGLGQQTHRSLDDVRMNLEVLKYCATVLFLESCLPDIFTGYNGVSPIVNTRRNGNRKSSPEGTKPQKDTPSSSRSTEKRSSPSLLNGTTEENHPIFSVATPRTREEVPILVESSAIRLDPFDMRSLVGEMERESLVSDDSMEEESSFLESLESSTSAASDKSNDCPDFLETDKVLVSCISAVLHPFPLRIHIKHQNVALQVSCRVKVLFGVNAKYTDKAGRSRLNFVVHAPPSLCHILDACDDRAQRLSIDSNSRSHWRPVVIRKAGYSSPTVRLHLPIPADGDTTGWTTEIYQKESSAMQRVVFSRFDVAELEALITPGRLMDAYFALDTYDYQPNAGIRLVAKKLIIHSS